MLVSRCRVEGISVDLDAAEVGQSDKRREIKYSVSPDIYMYELG